MITEILAHLDAGTALAAKIRADEETPQSDAQCYLARYQDVSTLADRLEASRGWPREVTAAWHFKHWGQAEGRTWECSGDAPPGPGRRFHHYNASAWDDRGVAVILCPGDKASSASIGGKAMQRHGNLDKGREVWALYRDHDLRGTLKLVIDGISFETEITDGGMTRGDCWRD